MKISKITKLYSFTNGNQKFYLGYGVQSTEDGKTFEEVIGNTRAYQEDMLKALNRAGWVYTKRIALPDGASFFPLFSQKNGDSNITEIRLEQIAKQNKASYTSISQKLLTNYKHDPAIAEKYRDVIPALREQPVAPKSAPAFVKPTPTITSKPAVTPQSKPTPAPVVTPQVTQPVAKAPQAVAPVSKPQQETRTASEQVVATIDAPIRPELEVNWVDNLTLPFIKNKTPEYEEKLLKIKQGVYFRPDRTQLLNDLGVKMITNQTEYVKFLNDFIEGNIDKEDARSWLNLNYFVDSKLLHTNIDDFHEDKLLEEYVSAKRKTFTPATIAKLSDMFKKYPSSFLTDTSLLGYKDLLLALNSGYEGSELFQACVQYFIEEPIEGFNHVYADSKVIIKPSIELPSLRESGDENFLLDFKYIPKINGEADFSKVKGKYEISSTHENHVSVKVKKPKPVLRFHARTYRDLTVEINHLGEVKIVSSVATGSATVKTRRFSNYFTIRSEEDSSVVLPFPSKDGKYKGMSESDYAIYSRLYAKIENTLDMDVRQTEYHVLDRIGYSAFEIEEYLKDDFGKSGFAEIRETIDNDVQVEEYLLRPDDEHVLEMAKIDSAFARVDNSSFHKRMLLALKHRVIMSPTATDFYRSDLTKVKPIIIRNLIDMAINYGYATPEQIYAELDRVKKTGEPVTFNTPVTHPWKVVPTAYYNFLNKLETEMRTKRNESMKTKAKVKSIVTNFTGTKELGVIMEVTVENDTMQDSGTYIETFLRTKKLVRDGAFYFTNGYVMEDRFSPFNRDAEIPSISIVEAMQAGPRTLRYGDKFAECGFNSYFTKTYKPVIGAHLSSGKDISEFVEPKTTYEIIFGNEQRSINSDPNQEVKKPQVSEPVEAHVEEPVSTTPSEIDQVGNITDEPSDAEVGVETPQQEMTETITASISSEIEVEDAKETPAEEPSLDETHEEETSLTVEEPKQTPKFKYAENNPSASIAFEIVAIVRTGKFNLEAKTIENADDVGIICKVENSSGTKSTLKISIVDAYKHMNQGKIRCVNGQIAVDNVKTDNEVRPISILNKAVRECGNLGSKGSTSLNVYVKKFVKAYEELKETGTVTEIPLTPLEEFNDKRSKAFEGYNKIIHATEQVQNTLRTIYDNAFKGRTKKANLVAVVPGHLVLNLPEQDPSKIMIRAIQTGEDSSKLAEFGIIKLPNGYYIAETINSKLIMLNEKLEEI